MDKSIKIQRTESVLRELIPEALSTLEDEMLRGVCVVDVECSRGKYDAIVYLDGNVYDAKEKSYILSHLERVKRHIQTHCMQTEGWFRCPNFRFRFDDSLERQNKMDALFAKVEEELKKGKKSDV
ncbi:MAG: 30S ribosome-binding factor RbfA [Sulfurospirillum sp.]|jgi:ribosome-binding factor A|nr:30S ribosome-binding factor RbfA [Sulfurospirillum sp.]MBP9491644.1 30S ribosome-binding factor RbfA [Sulfurospirillum sp.]MBP9612001.1 30S ribosome-binding factor RbfA [Sulfurospirillum sp.]